MKSEFRARENRAWTDADISRLEALWAIHGGKIRRIARIMGRTPGSISGKSMRLHLHFKAGAPIVLAPDSRPMVKFTTVFTSKVQTPGDDPLKPGANQRKLGGRVTKGPWKGMPIFSLTLEERATCPPTCLQLAQCYGNAMGRSVRYRHGDRLERELWQQLAMLNGEHRGGFVVRLHILGDYYSPEYVGFWRRALSRFPALRVFGYTAWQADTPIGAAVAALRDEQWDRFAIRTWLSMARAPWWWKMMLFRPER